jgi:hypothetical protein
MTRLRQVDDEGTWKVLLDPLESLEETKTTIPGEVIEATSFQFRPGHPDHQELRLRPLCVVRHPGLQHEYVVVEYFKACNPAFCEVFGRTVSSFRSSDMRRWKAVPEDQCRPDWTHILVDLECVPHSWIGFFSPHLTEALLPLQEPNTIKKDEWYMKQLRKTKAAYTGWEPEPSNRSLPRTLRGRLFGYLFSVKAWIGM